MDGPGIKVASQLVPVVKIKVDYQKTIIEFIEDEPYNFPTANEQIEKLQGEYYTC